MTIQEAIYCLSSYYIPYSHETSCGNCNYYKRNRCASNVAHGMAIEALKKELARSMPVIEPDDIDELL